MENIKYEDFLVSRRQLGGEHGFDPLWMPDFLFDFQKILVEWAVRKGRSAIFADCGLGKSPMELVWAQNVVMKTGGRVLVLCPLAVSFQMEREAEKFGVEASVSRDGSLGSDIVITNYEQLAKFDSSDFVGCVCDESSILKNFSGKTRALITEFMRKLPFRLLATATAAPNDYIELGTSSEAIGEMGFSDMISTFFKKNKKTYTRRDEHRGENYGFRGHAEADFWRWVCSWSRAVRRPSDLGCDDGPFILPSLEVRDHIVRSSRPADGCLFDLPAVGLQEQRRERRRTINERCERVAELVIGTKKPVVCWCHLNDEGDLLKRMIPEAAQVAGKDSDTKKEERLLGFARGDFRVLVTKPTIAAWGLNWQHCSNQTFFPSHSFEQWYQAVRRSWRFGQKNRVTVDIVTSEGEADVMKNLERKQASADEMFENLVRHMNESKQMKSEPYGSEKVEVPLWLS